MKLLVKLNLGIVNPRQLNFVVRSAKNYFLIVL